MLTAELTSPDDTVPGFWYRRSAYSYDADRHMLTVYSESSSARAATSMSVGEGTLTYNEHGDVATEAADDGADGTVDELTTWTYTYDAHGRKLTSEMWAVAGGLAVGGAESAYDTNGNVTSATEYSSDTSDQYTWSFDPDNNVLLETEDGDVNVTYAYTFSADPDASGCTRSAQRPELWR